MDRKELKNLIKPLVQECVQESVKEILLESGLLSKVITEVVKGISPILVEQKQEKETHKSKYEEILNKSEKNKLSETRKHLLDSIGKTSYNGVNVFEGISQTIPDEQPETSVANPMSGISAHDRGVDIESLFDFNKAKILAQGKKRQ